MHTVPFPGMSWPLSSSCEAEITLAGDQRNALSNTQAVCSAEPPRLREHGVWTQNSAALADPTLPSRKRGGALIRTDVLCADWHPERTVAVTE